MATDASDSRTQQAVPKPYGLERPADYAEPLASLTRGDWFFVFLTWLAIAWAIFITIDTVSGNGLVGFDFLPVAAGVPIIIAGWLALRAKARIEIAVDGLRGGAGLDLEGDIAVFESGFAGRMRFWSLASGSAIALCFFIYLFWIYMERRYDSLFLFILQLVVCVGVGFWIGVLLGRLLAYGQILSIMRDTGIAIGRIDTEQARTAIRQMENINRFAFLVTVMMCHWFAFWLWFWAFGGLVYRGYAVLFIALWVVSFGFYLFAARAPILAFKARLGELQGGAEGQEALDRQLAEAEDDLRKFRAAAIGVPSDDERELEALVKEFRARRMPSVLPGRWVLDLLAIWIAVLLFGSLLLSFRNGFVPGQ
ncbi:hypothetical protein [Mesorhizobium sp.]|uniref:hypothetical protein n=1 Tax=Mesorhizobium sp. TaxID=1871066 RepID=UPI000FE728CF|nr:hypothetical protein [Mesorhizobium sp.]RWP51079.1 MAG: hypothetical protein EOR05_03945 [Mesorhizobium sp.]